MISFDYAARHLRGVWRLACGDDDWRNDMDLTTDGVFASFWAVAFSVPFEIMGGMAEARIAAATPAYSSSLYASVPIAVMLGTQIIASLIAWGVTIAALVLVAQRVGASRESAGLIISYNWSQLLAYFSVMAPAAAIAVTGSAEFFVRQARQWRGRSIFRHAPAAPVRRRAARRARYNWPRIFSAELSFTSEAALST